MTQSTQSGSTSSRRPGPAFFIAVSLALVILASLGTWQLQRRAWKLDLIAQTEEMRRLPPVPLATLVNETPLEALPTYRPVSVTGTLRHDLSVRVFGAINGKPGAFIFTPMKLTGPLAGRDLIYVNRGFVPESVDHSEATRPAAETVVTGLLRQPEPVKGIAGNFKITEPSGDGLWYVRIPSKFGQAAGLEVLPIYIDSVRAESDGAYPQGGTTRIEFTNRHLEYAFTWYGLALTLVGVAFFYARRR
ncbi:MAG: SURF1 family protein [Pseudomonadota bacterium]